MNRETLDELLLKAHEDEDVGALVRLYRMAGEMCEETGDIDAACFYYTHAYVFALEAGHSEVIPLNQRLVSHGRAEELLAPV